MTTHDEYLKKLDQHSSAHRLDPLRDAVWAFLVAWDRENDQEKQDLSVGLWRTVGALRDVYESVERGAPEEVPEVEVTTDTQTRSPVHVEAPERPVERRRSGAKNVSDPKYQQAFIEESRAVMGQPSLQEAESFLNEVVVLTFNVDWKPVTGVLTDIIEHNGPTYLVLNDYRERGYPLNSIQSIKLEGS